MLPQKEWAFLKKQKKVPDNTKHGNLPDMLVGRMQKSAKTIRAIVIVFGGHLEFEDQFINKIKTPVSTIYSETLY